MSSLLTRLREHLDARLRAWLLGPKFHAEMQAAVLRLAALGQPPAVAAHPTAQPACSSWFALPGQVLELENTGFAIRLDVAPGKAPYHLFSPEGGLIAYGYELALLKACGERLAAERREFTAPAGMPPLRGFK